MLPMKSALTLLVVMALASSCREALGKNDPVITLLEVGPQTIVEYKDSVYIRLSFYDANGDLGENFTNDDNLFAVDERMGIAHAYRISNLVPGGANVSIQGELEFLIPSVFLTGSGPSEELSYTIYVVDRAGHFSNEINTGVLTVVK